MATSETVRPIVELLDICEACPDFITATACSEATFYALVDELKKRGVKEKRQDLKQIATEGKIKMYVAHFLPIGIVAAYAGEELVGLYGI